MHGGEELDAMMVRNAIKAIEPFAAVLLLRRPLYKAREFRDRRIQDKLRTCPRSKAHLHS
jgi:hypothetical protein